MTSRLRIVVFSPSIVSDIGNPMAATVRAICQALADDGHDVTHLEERGNPHVRELLLRHGSQPLRDFNDRHPLIRYRQYDLSRGWERVIWFGREIATADVVVAYPGVDDAVIQEVAAISSPKIIAFWPGTSGEEAALVPLWYAPADLAEMYQVVAHNNAAAPPDVDDRAKRLASEIERLLADRQSPEL
jgi:hypothetical protein